MNTLKYGFELEGFRINSEGVVMIPYDTDPVDGFPGLIELRSDPCLSIKEGLLSLIHDLFLLKDFHCFKLKDSYKFSAIEMSQLRKRPHNKEPVTVRNIYGKSPRHSTKTLASFQINISRVTRHEFIDKEGRHYPEQYSVFDFPSMIKNLDEEFKEEIKRSKRTPGWYAIKGNRVEYRSLPNTVFPLDSIPFLFQLAKRIEKCIWRVN